MTFRRATNPHLPTFLLAAAGLLLATGVCAQTPPPVVQPSAAQPPSVSGSSPRPRAAAARPPALAKAEAKPLWSELNPAQQQALAPLAVSWGRLSDAHKRKWLALSVNFPSLPATEQAKLHSRMAEWAALSPQQRDQARLNFAESQKVPDTEKKAKWEAYQALPPEEKRKLAAGATAAKPPAPPTAVALKPVPQQKLTTVPKSAREDPRAPYIAVAPPNKVDQNTLLPQPGALANQP